MYLVDFVRSLIKRGNISIIIYLVLNIIIIMLLVGGIVGDFVYSGGQAAILSAIGGLVIYAVSLAIALSPIGEWILRFQLGCKEVSRVEQINILDPIFREVYAKAKQADPSLPNDIRLFINTDDSVNAFATGRKTICVNRGLLNLPPDQIKATLAHEFGHISHKDTDLILVISVGNFVVTGIVLIIKIFVGFFAGAAGAVIGDKQGVLAGLSVAAIAGLMWIWTKIGTLLVMKSSRDSEYKADEFSFNLGYGNSLCALIETFSDADEKGLFAALSKSHPDKDDRIAYIQSLGADYRLDNNNYSYQMAAEQENNKPVVESRTSYAMAGFSTGIARMEHPNDNSIQYTSAQEKTINTKYANACGIKIVLVCEHCGAQLKEQAKFCSKCGKPTTDNTIRKRYCVNCGSEINRSNSRFCTKCGASLIVQ